MAPGTATIRRVLHTLLIIAAIYVLSPLPAAAAPLAAADVSMAESAVKEAGSGAVVMLASPLPAPDPLPTSFFWGIAILAIVLFYQVARLVIDHQRRDLELMRALT